MNEVEIEKAIERVKVNFALEDMFLTPDEIDNCRAILTGTISAETLIQKRKSELAALRKS